MWAVDDPRTDPRTDDRVFVYLAGGLRSGWQDKVIAEHPEWECMDPRTIQHLPMGEIVDAEKAWLSGCDEVGK